MEYLPQFLLARAGDVILNPVDGRCPFWSPAMKCRTKAEALTLAASLFPDQGARIASSWMLPEDLRAPGEPAATPEQLTYWVPRRGELVPARVKERRCAMIDARAGGAAQRRAGVRSTWSRTPSSCCLPRRHQAALEHGGMGEGAEGVGVPYVEAHMRERLRPLLSLWLDLLVLRLMHDGHSGHSGHKPVWFVLDELASLQRLPATHHGDHGESQIA